MADSLFRINRGLTLNPQAAAPASPANGDIYYDSTLNSFVLFNNGAWTNFQSRADVASASSLTSADFTASKIQSSVVRVTGIIISDLHGMVAAADAKLLIVYNQSSADMTVKHESSTETTATNRIITGSGQDAIIPAGYTACFQYDSAQSRWVYQTQAAFVPSTLPMINTAVGASLNEVALKADAELAKLFEDRNILLTDGGLITYTGTTVQFTENLNLVLHQRTTGIPPVVVSLGSATVNFSSSGALWYATVNRSAGTATLTAGASSLPSATGPNQEIFLIATRRDAGDGTKRLYWRNGMALNEGQTVRLGASGSGSGSGTGDDINTMQFKASFTDNFAESATSSTSAVASSISNAVYDAGKGLYRLNYDASKTVTGTGTAMTLSATPAYTVVAGDVLIVGNEARRITVVTSQTVYTIDSAFTTDPTAAAASVSQAVHSNDILSHTENSTGLAINAVITDSLDSFMLRYRDSAGSGDAIWDFPATALVSYDASSNNSTWTSKQSRGSALSTNLPIVSLPAAGTQFRARFYASATTGSGAVNLLDYKVFLFREVQAVTGSFSNRALCRTSGAGTEVNCSVSSDTGKTRITTTFAFGSEILIWLNGQKLPEFIDAITTPDASFTRISGNVIELDQDYSGTGLQFELLVPSNTVDNTSSNSTNIAAIQDGMKTGFQGFVDESVRLTAINGAPSSTQFRSSITNRASIPDLANDLKPRMAIERVEVQNIYQLQNEFGPNGEPVSAAVNDDRDLIRFVGDWRSTTTSNGSKILSSTAFNLTDYCEITFYGTGLNMLTLYDGTVQNTVYSVDGGADVGNIHPASNSAILSARNYYPNQVVSVVQGLTLGVHTVKLRNNSASVDTHIGGFEIINQSSSVNIRPGTAYINGKKLVLSTASSLSYNSGSFDSVLQNGSATSFSSTRGARVLAYLKSDSTIGRSAILTNSAQANMSSADHTNEELARVYHWREFGANRADDFSTLVTTSSAGRAFTLDDGTTTLVAANIIKSTTTTIADALQMQTSGSVTFTFVGTGIDLESYGDITAAGDPHSFILDGTTIATLSTASVANTRVFNKVASGLPYGTHTLKITRNAATVGSAFNITKFFVYQPKKPSIPAGAVELADYNVMADFVTNGTAGSETIAIGVLRKQNIREFVYGNGTGGTADWTAGAVSVIQIGGWQLASDRLNAYLEYTFFGTGFELRFANGSNRSTNISVTLNGLSATTANFATLASFTYGTGVAFSAGVLDQADASPVFGCGLRINGLPLAKYTVRFNNNTASSYLVIDTLDIITPIHSHKSNINYDAQNTLPVGSQGISDNRKTSAIKEINLQKKNISQAVGVTSPTSTTSSSFVPCPDMSVIHFNTSGKIAVNYFLTITNTSAGGNAAIFVDGVQASVKKKSNTLALPVPLCDRYIINVSPGFHKIDIYWLNEGGTIQGDGVNRSMSVEEV